MDFGSEYVFLKSEALKRKARNLNDATTAPSQEPPQPAEVAEKIESADEDVDEFEEEDLKQGIRTHSIKSTTSTEVPKEKPKATRKFRKVDTNVFRVDLSTLSQEAYMATGDPIFCEKCKAVFSSISKLDGAPQVSAAGITVTVEDADNPEKGKEKEGEKEEDGKDRSWVCEFCEHENKVHIESEELPQSDTMDFVLEVPGRTELSAEENNVIFCVDTSGSMCVTTEVQGRLQLKLGAEKMANLHASLNPEGGQQYMPGWSRNVTYISRIQCMQAAVGAQLEVLEREQSNKRVGLVSFASDVLITGDGKQESKVVAGDKLNDYEELSRIATQFALENPISETREALGSKLNALEESGATALGPALLVSVVMASKKPGSKVILCTDGLANIGLGSMETEEEMESAKAFYTRVAEFAKDNGVIINVISIKGTTCSMEILGLLADITSGEVDIVDPLLLTTNFHSILSIPVIAVHVSATVLLHEGLFLRDEEDRHYENRLEKKIGSVTKESNLTVEYGCKQGFQLDESVTSLPFQVQIHYTKLDGTKMVRVVSRVKPITTKREEAEQKMDRKVLGLNSVKKSARYAQSGDYESARLHGYSTTRLMSRNLDERSVSEYSAYVSAAEALDSELLTAQIEEESERPATLNNYGYDISGGSEELKTRRLVTRAKSKDTTSKTIYKGTSAGYTIFEDDAPTRYPVPSTSNNSVGPSSEPDGFGYRLTPVDNFASTGDSVGYAVSSSSPPGEESTTSTTATTGNNFGYELSSGKPSED